MDLSLAPVSWQPVLRVQDLMKEQFALLLSFVLEFYKILEMGQDKPLIDKKKKVFRVIHYFWTLYHGAVNWHWRYKEAKGMDPVLDSLLT